MKRTRKIICCVLLCASLAACASPPNPEPSVESGTPSAPETEESAALFHDDFITCAGNVEITWTPDYERSEWAESTPINLFVRLEDNPDLQLIEDEANHYLHQAGKDYCLHIVTMGFDEFLSNPNLDDQFIRTQDDGTAMDMYMTFDYKAAVAAGEVLNLTDYLQSPEGQKVYARYDEMVWAQLEDENGQIYGIPSNPIAAKRMVYYYCPQIAEYLSLDRERFTGDLRDLEGEFSRMEEAGILPLCLALLPENPLLSSLFGLENYGEIFAIRHEGEGLEAVNVLEDDAWMDFYRLLGRWRAEGHILYSPEALRDWGLSEEEALAEEARWEDYLYPLFNLAETDDSSWHYSELTAEGGRMTCAYCVPQVPAYITEDVNSNILVINRDTAVPDACLDLLTLLKTDTTLMRLLYCGIEHYHYQWEDERIIFRSAGYAGGLGYELDRRFLNAASEEQFNREFEDLNYGVDFGLAYSSPCAFSDEELALKYQACREIMEDNLLVFRGYYGEDTGSRLETVKQLLYDAGYQELIAALNSGNTP